MNVPPTFRAYAMARPDGWPSGWYDGTFGDDGVRLACDGAERLYVPPKTGGVSASGAELTLPTPDGPLVVRVQSPPPTDPAATALAIALALADSKRERERVLRAFETPWWLWLLPAIPPLLGPVAGISFGVGGRAVCTVAGLVSAAVVFGTRWSVNDRAAVAGLVAVGAVVVAAAGLAVQAVAR